MNDFEIKSVSNGLQALASLKDLSLSDCGEIGNAGIESLSKGVAKLTSLRSLRLDFRVNSDYPEFDKLMSAEGLVFLFKALKKLEALENLILDFQG